MTRELPILAGRTRAARLLDLKPSEFDRLVESSALPGPRKLGGLERWSVDELRAVAAGSAVDGLGDVQW